MRGSVGGTRVDSRSPCSVAHIPQAFCSFCLHTASLRPSVVRLLPSHALLCFRNCGFYSPHLRGRCVCSREQEAGHLVTFHYLVEILFRFPPMVFFFLVWGFWSMLLLFVGDVLLTVLLLLFPKFSLSSCGCFGVNWHNTHSHFGHSSFRFHSSCSTLCGQLHTDSVSPLV